MVRIVEVGIGEIARSASLIAVAQRYAADRKVFYTGLDWFDARTPGGGPPRNRVAENGELYILDLGVGFRGYHSDNARTIAVGGEPSTAQQRAWHAASEIFPYFESYARPEASCAELFHSIERRLNENAPWVFDHHLGHGVGLAPQEGPHLNPRWDDVLAEGDFIAVEPGLYHEELRAGVRLEQNYVVTHDGVELLTDWPLDL